MEQRMALVLVAFGETRERQRAELHPDEAAAETLYGVAPHDADRAQVDGSVPHAPGRHQPRIVQKRSPQTKEVDLWYGVVTSQFFKYNPNVYK